MVPRNCVYLLNEDGTSTSQKNVGAWPGQVRVKYWVERDKVKIAKTLLVLGTGDESCLVWQKVPLACN